ncbi:hypothetical protein ACOSQ2_002738 [Xanthoceras sorbifolium]
MEFLKSVADALQGNTNCPSNLLDSTEATYQVADCDYDSGTNWGKKIGPKQRCPNWDYDPFKELEIQHAIAHRTHLPFQDVPYQAAQYQ